MPQHAVFTSSPPRCRKLSGKRPDGAPLALALPPVHSLSREEMSVKVSSLATLSGWLQPASPGTDGQTPG